MWTAVAHWLRRCATNLKVAGSIPAGVIGFFIDIKSFRSRYGLGVESASKSGNLDFLRTLWACPDLNGTALLLPLPFYDT